MQFMKRMPFWYLRLCLFRFLISVWSVRSVCDGQGLWVRVDLLWACIFRCSVSICLSEGVIYFSV